MYFNISRTINLIKMKFGMQLTDTKRLLCTRFFNIRVLCYIKVMSYYYYVWDGENWGNGEGKGREGRNCLAICMITAKHELANCNAFSVSKVRQLCMIIVNQQRVSIGLLSLLLRRSLVSIGEAILGQTLFSWNSVQAV